MLAHRAPRPIFLRAQMPLNDKDHKFAGDVLNASLTFLAILIAVITLLIAEYKSYYSDQAAAEKIHIVLMATTYTTVYVGCIALYALFHLRSDRFNSTTRLAWGFAAIIAAVTAGVIYLVNSLAP
jgi:hypothetical protein